VEVTLTKPARKAPSKIVLHLPENRSLVSPADGVTVATRSQQKVRWDFPTVIRRYQKLGQVESNTMSPVCDLIGRIAPGRSRGLMRPGADIANIVFLPKGQP